MGRTRTGRNARRVRTAVAAAVGVLALATLTAGCRIEDAGAAGSTAPPAVATARPTASASTDDGKPGGGTPSPSATPSRTPGASPSPAARTLMSVGDRSERVRELQARLRQIGHFDRSPTGYYGTATVASVQSFQGKRGLSRTGRTDTVTWERLLAMTRKPTAKELDPPAPAPAAAKPDARCLTGRVLCISKNDRTLSWMIDGRVVSSMDVRFGSQYTPTREGTFSVYWKSRHHVSTLYDSPMPYAMFFSGGQAVHYSSDFAARGYSGASHGCVNVRDEGKIASLFDQVRNGDKVVIYW
ncbi:Peptidoglycan-binding (PGRP) domain of peptidoglycan hydrolases-containing protein [Streptomyces sp. LamerLS-316]|uniref:L,D-transpeptidase family protein n=1 Tax=unclassified Streptomyces TaxID=2593676 RepID=UPI0008238670|nr:MULTISPECIES: L,D-transpeptidase family protein [unclassified Streptomyces]MYQ42657.1 L,D-transpeptidase family protein [Streptomyces sp. SID4921]SCK32157.1 Peptidoglycan-binding (PGRP) domain of peptidoglycan hydrolases-containing protein [Streptomyces sp. LamerLS-316]